jgi:hypothetical protein
VAQPDTASRASVRRSAISSVKAGFLFHPLDEGFAIGSLAAGFGGDQTAAHDIARIHFGAADAQALNGLVHGFDAQRAMVGEPGAKAHNAGETVNHTKAGARRLGDQQAAIVGAKIERGIGGTVGGRALLVAARPVWRRVVGCWVQRAGVSSLCWVFPTEGSLGSMRWRLLAGLTSELPSMRAPAIAG